MEEKSFDLGNDMEQFINEMKERAELGIIDGEHRVFHLTDGVSIVFDWKKLDLPETRITVSEENIPEHFNYEQSKSLGQAGEYFKDLLDSLRSLLMVGSVEYETTRDVGDEYVVNHVI